MQRYIKKIKNPNNMPNKIDSINVSGSSYDIQDAAATTALGGLKLVKLTQQQYDALSPNYDANTLYIVSG